MELLQLKYFVESASCLNFTKVAEMYFVPQSSISHAIARLEKELGCKLFDRCGRNVVLNTSGKAFYKRALSALQSLEDGVYEAQNVDKHIVRLKCFNAERLIPGILVEFKKLHPEINIILEPYAYMETDCDLSIDVLPHRDPESISIPLFTEKIVVAMSTEHSLARYDSVRLEDLKDEPVLGLAPGKRLEKIMQTYCSLFNYSPKVVIASSDALTLRGCIEGNLGIAYIPEITWTFDWTDKMKKLSISDVDCKRIIGIAEKRGKVLSDNAKILKKFVIDYFACYNESSEAAGIQHIQHLNYY